MKKISTMLFSILFAVSIFAQTYPEVSIKDIQFELADSLLFYGAQSSEPKPNFLGDTVVVTGVVMNPPYQGVNPDSTRTLHAGAAAIYLQDTAQTEWSGILVRDPGAFPAFAVLDTGLVIKFTAVVSEFFTTTQLSVVDFQASNILGSQERPQPVELTLDSLVEIGTSNPNFLAEKWEGVYVEFKNVTTSDPNIIGNNSFSIFDGNNSNIVVGTNSDYWRQTPAPLPGTRLEYVRGYIETRTNIPNGWFMINPVFPNDIKFGTVSPPNIDNVVRDKGIVGFNEAVTVTAHVFDSDSTSAVKSATLKYSVSDTNFVDVPMTLTDSSTMIWTATIPGQPDSTLIAYYIEAVDGDSAVATNPTGGKSSPYFYMTLNRPLTIQDVRYSPFGSGFSGYNGFEVTVDGVVTADTSDIEGDGNLTGKRVYLQNGSGPWSGIQIFGTETDALKRGNEVQISGIVNENFGVTRIGNLTNGAHVVAILTSNAQLPPFTELSTADIDGESHGKLPAESYSSVLVSFKDVVVTDENADGNPGPDQGSGGNRNFGEIRLADTSGVSMRVELQDGTHDYHNFWDPTFDTKPLRVQEGNSFSELDGIMFYSFGNYKLVPRKNDDFKGFVTDVKSEKPLPLKFELSQNYPNPFNPSTIINYSIPNFAGNENFASVQLKIYDVLGREVATLVNRKQQPGNYEVSFNAVGLASGIYFYRLTAGNKISVKKMMLIK